MIALENINLQQGAFTLELDLTVERGERLAVIGASGAGKSTLLNLTAGFQQPDVGRVLIDGRDVTADPVAARPVSILFQDGNLFPHLSVFDNVALGLRPDLRMSPNDRASVDAALDQVGLSGFSPRRPGDLSGGQAARVALARMLLRDKPVALMDEPFSALDPGLRQEMAALVAELCSVRGITLVIVAHELRGLEAFASDLCLMDGGKIALMDRFGTLHADRPDQLRPWL